eukprot:364215-Chlamydomonas_euryale.AAC.10
MRFKRGSTRLMAPFRERDQGRGQGGGVGRPASCSRGTMCVHGPCNRVNGDECKPLTKASSRGSQSTCVLVSNIQQPGGDVH